MARCGLSVLLWGLIHLPLVTFSAEGGPSSKLSEQQSWTLELSAYVLAVLGNNCPHWQWLIQLTCAHWPGVDGRLTHILHHDLKESSLLELGGQSRLCDVPVAGPTVHAFPQPDERKAPGFQSSSGWCKAALPQVEQWFKWQWLRGWFLAAGRASCVWRSFLLVFVTVSALPL